MVELENVPPALKSIRTFLKRASELEKSQDPNGAVISYYCRAYAMQKAFALGVAKEDGVQAYLVGLMDTLELQKANLNVSKAEGKDIIKTFSLGVFKRADDEYRAGLANKNTARTFFAASSFLEVNKHFEEDGETDSELENLRKYAKLKASEILTAIKEGRQPLPPEMVKAKEAEAEEEDNEEEEVVIPKASLKETRNVEKSVEPTKNKIPKKARRQTRLAPRGDAGTEETRKAEGLARLAVRALQSDKFQEAGAHLSAALSVLESKTPVPTIDDRGVTEQAKEDALEYAYFAARALECIGQDIEVDDGIDLAVNHLSDALGLLESS